MADKYCNRLVYAADVAHKQERHRRNLRRMKPTSKSNARGRCDNSSPQRYVFLRNKLKTKMMKRDVQKQVEHENLLLMRKLFSIKTREAHGNFLSFKPGFRLDANQSVVLDNYVSGPQHCHGPGDHYPKESLNREKRARSKKKIVRDNLGIMRSIEGQKGFYNCSEWENDRKEAEKFLSRMQRNTTVGHLSRRHQQNFKNKSKTRTATRRASNRPAKTSSPKGNNNNKSRRGIDGSSASSSSINSYAGLGGPVLAPIESVRSGKLRYAVTRQVSGHPMQITVSRAGEKVVILVHDMAVHFRYRIELLIPDDDLESDRLQSQHQVRAMLMELAQRVCLKDEDSDGIGVIVIGPSPNDAAATIQRGVRRRQSQPKAEEVLSGGFAAATREKRRGGNNQSEELEAPSTTDSAAADDARVHGTETKER